MVLGLALAPAAPAQQGATLALGGRLDGGVQLIDDGRITARRVDSGLYTASRVYLRGSEPLAPDLEAAFFMEHRFAADTGAQASAGRFWNAEVFVGLAGKDWGRLTLGRQYVPMFWAFLFADDTGPLRLHNYGAVQSVQRSNTLRIAAAASPAKLGGTLDSLAPPGVYSVGIGSAFEDNLAVYRTPDLGGLSFSLAAGAAEGGAGGAAKVLGGNVELRRPGVYLAAAVNTKQGQVAAAPQRLRESLLSGMLDLAPGIKLWGNVHPWRFTTLDHGVLSGTDAMLGASWWRSSGEWWLSAAAKRLRGCARCGSRGLGLGYQHLLSRCTELYLAYAHIANQADAANPLAGIAPAAPGLPLRGLGAGLAHQF